MNAPACSVTVAEDAILADLSDEQLDHVSLGLTHVFGVVLRGSHKDGFVLEGEDGWLVAVHERTISVKDVWEVAEAMEAQ